MIVKSGAAVGSEISGPAIRPDVTTWIYFFAIDNDSHIKIGQAKNLEKRIKQEQRTSAQVRLTPIEILAAVKGKASDEGFVQSYFRHLLVAPEISQENFRPELELIEYIRWLRDQGFVAVQETKPEKRDELARVDASAWLPDSSRRKQRPLGWLPGTMGTFDLGPRKVTADDFYTNAIITDAAREVMGRIDLDPASCAEANTKVRAERIYTFAEDGLRQEWSGRVWLNPPFSQWEAWVPKILAEWRRGQITEMCVLSAMRTVTSQFFAVFLDAVDAMCITKGRIKFWGGVAGDSPDDGHAIYYFGPHREKFRRCFAHIGTTLYGATR